jgi:hypothetical protein
MPDIVRIKINIIILGPERRQSQQCNGGDQNAFQRVQVHSLHLIKTAWQEIRYIQS